VGAVVHLETYDGGHGWHGDVFGMIRRAAEWLISDAPGDEVKKTPSETGAKSDHAVQKTP
jgi:hypothetical protein